MEMVILLLKKGNTETVEEKGVDHEVAVDFAGVGKGLCPGIEVGVGREAGVVGEVEVEAVEVFRDHPGVRIRIRIRILATVHDPLDQVAREGEVEACREALERVHS